MQRSITLILFVSIILSCSKSQEEKSPGNCEDMLWLTQKKAEYSNCVCITGIYQGTYEGETIFLIRGMDPLCNDNGMGTVYKPDGTQITYSSQQAYQSFLSSVQNLQLIWSCTKSN